MSSCRNTPLVTVADQWLTRIVLQPGAPSDSRHGRAAASTIASASTSEASDTPTFRAVRNRTVIAGRSLLPKPR
jgi:hypothetical protein